MTANPVAFYVLATVIAGGSLGVVSLRSQTHAAAALAIGSAATGLLEAVSGARLLATLQLVLIGAVAAVVVVLRRRGDGGGATGGENGTVRWWPAAAAPAVGLGLFLVWTLASNGGSWAHGGAPAALVSVFHHRDPLVLAIVVVLLATALAGGRVVGGVSDDERELERRLEERRRRDERTRRRREDREAARARRDPVARGGTQ